MPIIDSNTNQKKLLDSDSLGSVLGTLKSYINHAFRAVINGTQDALNKKIDEPEVPGVDGQILQIDTGVAKWVTPGTPSSVQVRNQVNAYLEAHPEMVTTVVDGSITRAKLDNDLKNKTDAIATLNSAYLHHGKNSCVEVTLDKTLWVENMQDATVEGVLSNEAKQVIEIYPSAASTNKYLDNAVWCDSQTTNRLTFKCLTVPDDDLVVYAVITEVAE